MATPSYAPIVGGTETAVRELARALRRRGHTVDVLTLNMDAKWDPRWSTCIEEDDGGKTVRWGAWNPLHRLRTPRLNRLVGRHVDGYVVSRLHQLAMVHVLLRRGARRFGRRYDVVHCHDETDLSLALALDAHVMHLHTMSESLGNYRRHRLARRLLVGSAGAWIANSRDSARKAEQVGVPVSRVRVIPNGVDADAFTPSDSVREGVLFVGRLVPRKGVDVLLDALRLVSRPTRVRIVGVPADTGYASRVADLAADVQLATRHRIELLGPKTSEELRPLYQQASIVVCPSRIEPFGLVALEAMSSGAAVLASRVDGLQELIDDGVTGLLSPAGDASALAAHLERLLVDESLRRDLGCGARQQVLSRYTWPEVASQVERFYAEMLS